MIELNSSSVKSIAIFTMFLSLCSCGIKTVVAPDAKEYTGDLITGREVVFSGGALAEDYKVQQQDVLEVSFPDYSLFVAKETGEKILHDRDRLRLPIWAYHRFEAVDLTKDSNTKTLCFKNCDGAKKHVVDLDTLNALEILTKLEDSDLRGRILPRDPGMVGPGDRVLVSLEISSNFQSTDLRSLTGTIVNHVNVESQVDHNGAIAIPRFENANEATESRLSCDRTSSDLCIPAVKRAAIGAFENSADQVQVFNRSRDQASFALWRVERCLAAVTWQSRSSEVAEADEEERDRCRNIGIGPHFLPNSDLNYVRGHNYSLAPSDQSWTLIDVRGNAYDLPFEYGVSVHDAIAANYARTVGKPADLDGDQLSGASVYVTLFPRDDASPLFAELSPRKSEPSFKRLALKPGDRVFVTRYAPELSQ